MTLIITVLLLNTLILTTQSTTVYPCKVQSVTVQPQLGISAKTQKLVKILQESPGFTQSVHADICIVGDTETGHFFPDIPPLVCQQRYSAVEVFLKPLEEDGIPNIQKLLALSEKQLYEFAKDFIVVEAGCDYYMNFLPLKSLTKNSDRKRVGTALLPGVASLHRESESSGVSRNSPQHFSTPASELFVERTTSPESNPVEYSDSNVKNSSLKARSMIRSDFFRKGFYLHAEVSGNTTTTERTFTQQQSFTEYDSKEQGSKNDKLAEGEIRLTPDNIGLPLLILESSLDPVMKIISQFSSP